MWKWIQIFSLAVVFHLGAYEAKDYSNLLGMPGFSDHALKVHIALYQGYVKNSTRLFAELQKMGENGQRNTYAFGALKRMFGWEFDGMRLHELYFDALGGNGELLPEDAPVLQAIKKQFGSFEAWKKAFIATGMIRGIGWAVLSYDPETKQLINGWVNEHDLGHLVGAEPLLVMDVFEHAYMLDYGLDRAAYIEAFFANLNWDVVCSRLCKRAKLTESKGNSSPSS